MSIASSASCSVLSEFTPAIGNPPPNSMDPSVNAGKRVYSGDSGMTASCRVHDNGGNNFSVSASIQAPGSHGAFTVEGTVAGTTGTASVALSTRALEGAVRSPDASPCTLGVVTSSNGAEIHPGAIWSTFHCPQLVGSPNPVCVVNGEFVLENCSK